VRGLTPPWAEGRSFTREVYQKRGREGADGNRGSTPPVSGRYLAS
jgi:hypothetical protein